MPIYKKVNKDFFKKWSSKMSYILGFFAADGYITINNRGGNFWCIEIVDGSLLRRIKKEIGSNHKISFRISKNTFAKKQYRLQIGSIEMCNDLKKLGYGVRKTKSLSVPNIPDKYLRDFVRGYFDGDGNVWVGLVHKERKTKTLAIQTVFTSCSKLFLDSLSFRLKEFGISNGIVRKGFGNYYRLVYSIKGSLKLYNFMYNSSYGEDLSLYLNRKKKVFEKYIRMRA